MARSGIAECSAHSIVIGGRAALWQMVHTNVSFDPEPLASDSLTL